MNVLRRIPAHIVWPAGLCLWGSAALSVGYFLGAVVLPGMLSNERALVRMEIPELVYHQPRPAAEIAWHHILAGDRPDKDVREAVVRTARQCLEGPLIPDRPAIQASYYPWNRCACLAAEIVAAFSPDDMFHVSQTLMKGYRLPPRLVPGWVGVSRACRGGPSGRFATPRSVSPHSGW